MNSHKSCVRYMARYVNDHMRSNNIGPKELAKRTGLSDAEIRNIRDAKLKKVSMHSVSRLTRYLGCSVEELLGTKNLPENLSVNYGMVEYEEPFYRYYGDRLFGIHDCFGTKYDDEYESVIVNTVHSFVRAHMLAVGYFQEGLDKQACLSLTKEKIESDFSDAILQEFLNVDCVSEEESIGKEDFSAMVGKNVRTIREYRKMTRIDLETKSGISRDIIYKIETGEKKSVDYEQLIKISVACVCSIDFLLGDSIDPVADANGRDVFCGLSRTFIEKHVDVGHDLAYISNYMDKNSKQLAKGIIDYLNLMYKQKRVTDSHNCRKLSMAEVYVREQTDFRATHPNRGYRAYKPEYK